MNRTVEKKTIQIQIAGVDYCLKSERDPEEVKAIARYVDERITELSSSTHVKSQTKIAVLVALNIAEELFGMKQQYRNTVEKLERYEALSKELCDRVDQEIDQYLQLTE